jgi:hypothetical protein
MFMPRQEATKHPEQRTQAQAKAESDQPVRLSVNLSPETAGIFRALIERKALSITEGVRRAIAVWKFVEDEAARGNELAVIEPDGEIRKIVLL